MTDNKPPFGPKVPRFRVQLTHPTSSDDAIEGRRSILRVEEIASSLNVFELELTSADLHELLSQRWAYPALRRIGLHPERWGHEMRTTTSTHADEAAAEVARLDLESRGWLVEKIRRNNQHRYVVTGRRWDDGDADE